LARSRSTGKVLPGQQPADDTARVAAVGRARSASAAHRMMRPAIAGDRRKIIRALRRAYPLLRRHFGHQHWWPGETPIEVCVGAILTQSTAWANVERALGHLKARDLLEARRLLALPEAELASLIRPAGYFNVKARRLRAFLAVLVHDCDGDLARLLGGDCHRARQRLLAIKGIGPETADSMLLYAGGQKRFVIDAYTRRVFSRHGWCSPEASYEMLQDLCESALDHRPERAILDYWQDYHAQLVMTGKEYCQAREARCARCPLAPLLSARIRLVLPRALA
jgi:endonuclease-3 related protein